MNSDTKRYSAGPLVLYELNEVPWRVIDWYLARRPESTLNDILAHSHTYTPVTKDEGELHPWSTWPTVHRGVYNSTHRILFLNQDRAEASPYPPIWEIAAEAGLSVGVFGSLQSYPPDPASPFAFYIPDTFAPGPETIPKSYEPFQRINLRQTKQDGAVASKVKLKGSLLIDVAKLKFIGVSFRTFWRIVSQLANEKRNALYRTRRPIMQAPIAFDVFTHALATTQPDFCTFFTNHVAGIMHRYWRYAFPEDFKFTLKEPKDFFHQQSLLVAMDLVDEHLTYLRDYVDKRNGQLLIASSMGQEAVERDYHGELRITDEVAFVRALDFDGRVKWHLAMQPDFNFEFQTIEDAVDFSARLGRVITNDGQLVFFRRRLAGKTLNAGLGNPSDVLENERLFFVRDDGSRKRLNLQEAGIQRIWRDVGTGYHQPQGLLVWYAKDKRPSGDRDEIESIAIAPMILQSLGISHRANARD